MKLGRMILPTAAAMVLLGLFGVWRTGGGVEDYVLMGSAAIMVTCVFIANRKKPNA